MRVRSVTPKPGYVFDGANVVPARGNVVPMPIARDGLRNAITGAGTSRDARSAYGYGPVRLTQHDIASAFSGSGLLRKIVQIPALDMVREWRDWKIDQGEIGLIEAEERRLQIRQKVKQAEILRGLGGGALILGLPGELNQPAPKTGKGGLAFVHVVSRWHLSFRELESDARLPGYGEPVMWQLASLGGSVDIHPSRVVPFRGDLSLSLIMPGVSSDDAFWGESVVAQVLDAVKDSDAARASFAALLHKARLLRIGIPDLSGTLSQPGGEAQIQARLSVIALAESIHNATIYDSGADGKSGEAIQDATYSFAGAKDILNAYAEFVSAISDIPATRLLGRAPEGMNSSGDSQQQDWRKKVRARQTIDLAPCLDRLDAHLVPSAIGKAPDGGWYDFAPLDVPTEAEEAERFKTTAEALEKVQVMGVIPERAFNKAAQSTLSEGGWMPGLDDALAEVPEDERYGLESDMGLEEGGDPESGDEGGDTPNAAPPSPTNDATPRPLYVRRDLLNAGDLIAWAKANGLTSTLPADDMHVTVLYSRTPVDPMKLGEPLFSEPDGGLVVKAGGPRSIERFGEGALVLEFTSWALSSRHADMLREGATSDYPEYRPHVTLTYEAPADLDLDAIKPFAGELRFGPEIFEPLDLDWKSKIKEG